METTARGEKNPEFIPNDSKVINLEHIMPQELNNEWPTNTQQNIETHFARIGNMILLQADKNSALGASGFETKKATYANSTL
jgi:hypothetical protein